MPCPLALWLGVCGALMAVGHQKGRSRVLSMLLRAVEVGLEC